MENKELNLEQTYVNFIFNTLNYFKEQSKFIEPGNMFDEYSERKDILISISDICALYNNKSEIFFEIIKEWIIYLKGKSIQFNNDIEIIFEFLNAFTNLSRSENTINKWLTQLCDELKTIEKKDIKMLNPEDLIQNKNILRIVRNITKDKL